MRLPLVGLRACLWRGNLGRHHPVTSHQSWLLLVTRSCLARLATYALALALALATLSSGSIKYIVVSVSLQTLSPSRLPGTVRSPNGSPVHNPSYARSVVSTRTDCSGSPGPTAWEKPLNTQQKKKKKRNSLSLNQRSSMEQTPTPRAALRDFRGGSRSGSSPSQNGTAGEDLGAKDGCPINCCTCDLRLLQTSGRWRVRPGAIRECESHSQPPLPCQPFLESCQDPKANREIYPPSPTAPSFPPDTGLTVNSTRSNGNMVLRTRRSSFNTPAG